MSSLINKVALASGLGLAGLGVFHTSNKLEQLEQNNTAITGQLEREKNTTTRRENEAAEIFNQLRGEITRLKEEVNSKVTFNDVPEMIASNRQNTLMTSDRYGSSWTSSLLRINDRLYILSCAHSFNDPIHFLSNELEFKAFDESYSFKAKPIPFEDGSIGLFGRKATGLDISIFPLTEEIVSKLPDRGNRLGVELEDISKMPRHGSFVYTLANSAPLSHSIHLGPVVHPHRQTYNYDGTTYHHDIEHFTVDYGNSGAPLFPLTRKGRQVGVISWGPREGGISGGPPRSFSVNGAAIKQALSNELGLPVLTREDEGLLALENFLMPTPSNPLALSNVAPKKERKLVNIKILNAVKNIPVFSPDPFCQAASIVVANHTKEINKQK